MSPSLSLRTILATTAVTLCLAAPTGAAEENYETWPLLQRTFPSTGGGGIIIGEYDPVIVGSKCVTDFTATELGGKVYYNVVEFDAVPAQGGILCTEGKWRARDGSAAPRHTGCSSRTACAAARRKSIAVQCAETVQLTQAATLRDARFAGSSG